MGPARQRALVVLVVLVVAGCGASQPTSQASGPASASASVAPPAIAPSLTPTIVPSASTELACPPAADGVSLDDPASGASLVMPKGWHRMVPGDPAWKTIFGDDRSVETSLSDGTMQAFAIPLDTRDARLLSLAIYVRPTTISDVTTVGQDYAGVWQSARFAKNYDLAVVTSEDTVSLPTGLAFRIEATMHYTGSASPTLDLPTWDDHMLGYVVLGDVRAYYLVFRGKEHIFANHLDAMECMVRSLRLTDPVPSK